MSRCLLCVLVLAAPFWARAEEIPGLDEQRSPEALAEIQAAFRKKLSRKVSLEFEDTPFEEALQFLNSLIKVGIIIDPRAAADDNGLKHITLKFQNVPMYEVLEKMCDLGGLHWELRDRLFITSEKRFRDSISLAIYDVRGLHRTTDELGYDWLLGINEEARKAALKDYAARLKEEHAFVDSIKALAPEAWKSDAVSVETRGGKLVVLQTPLVQFTIARHLDKLRKSKDDAKK